MTDMEKAAEYFVKMANEESDPLMNDLLLMTAGTALGMELLSEYRSKQRESKA